MLVLVILVAIVILKIITVVVLCHTSYVCTYVCTFIDFSMANIVCVRFVVVAMNKGGEGGGNQNENINVFICGL